MLSARSIRRRQAWISALWAVMLTAAVFVAYQVGLFKRADNFFYDLQVKWRGPRATSGQVVLVLMDEASARELERRKGHWSRRQLAAALDHLCHAGAEIIGLDMVLSAADDDSGADRELAQSMQRCNNLVLARVSSAEVDGGLGPLPLFAEAMIGDGFIDVPLDGDEVLRRIRYLSAKPLPDGGLQLLPAFSLELVRAFKNIDFTLDFSAGDQLRLGTAEAALQLPYPELLINYYGNYTAFTRLSYADVVNNRFDPASVEGRIVIVGSSLATQKDFFTTPFSRFGDVPEAYKEKFGTVVGGVLGSKEIGAACHAHAVETMLNRAYIGRPQPRTRLLLLLAAALLGSLFYLPRSGMLREVVGLGAGLAGIAVSAYLLFLYRGLWLDSAPLMGVLVLHFVAAVILQKAFEKQRGALVAGLFGKYVSPAVVDELLKGDITPSLEGQRRELTVLFSDLRNFTALSEELGAKQTSELLNHYFDAMIPVVFAHHGTLDKLMGDAIMAFFGAPVHSDSHPCQAAETAVRMVGEIERLKRSALAGAERLEAGIGLNTGTVTVGNLGSSAFMDYTIIGDDVNLASRLEGLNKIYGTHIIVSGATAARLDERFFLREIDWVRVKGKQQKATIFELVGFNDALTAQQREAAAAFAEGLAAYRRQAWPAAQAAFERALQKAPADRAAQLYLERVAQRRRNPPAADWDAVTVFDHK